MGWFRPTAAGIVLALLATVWQLTPTDYAWMIRLNYMSSSLVEATDEKRWSRSNRHEWTTFGFPATATLVRHGTRVSWQVRWSVLATLPLALPLLFALGAYLTGPHAGLRVSPAARLLVRVIGAALLLAALITVAWHSKNRLVWFSIISHYLLAPAVALACVVLAVRRGRMTTARGFPINAHGALASAAMQTTPRKSE